VTTRPVAAGRVRAAVRAGAVSGLLSGAPSTAWAIVRGDDLFAPSLAAGSLVLPHETRRGRLLVAAFVSHSVLSVGWAFVMVRLWPRRHESLARAVLRGSALGATIGMIDLGAAHVVAHPRLAAVRGLSVAPQVADHVAYGAIVGVVLRGQTRSMASTIESSTRPGR
jgi:hypothetical protein